MNTSEGQQEWCKRPKNYRKKTEVVRQCDENERAGHSEKNGMDTPGNIRRGQPNLRRKDTCKRDMTKVGLNEDNTTKRAACRNKIISYTGDPR